MICCHLEWVSFHVEMKDPTEIILQLEESTCNVLKRMVPLNTSTQLNIHLFINVHCCFHTLCFPWIGHRHNDCRWSFSVSNGLHMFYVFRTSNCKANMDSLHCKLVIWAMCLNNKDIYFGCSLSKVQHQSRKKFNSLWLHQNFHIHTNSHLLKTQQ